MSIISFLVILCFGFFHIKVWLYLKKPTNGNTVILLHVYLPSIASYHVNKMQRMKKKIMLCLLSNFWDIRLLYFIELNHCSKFLKIILDSPPLIDWKPMRVRQTDRQTLKVSEGILKYPTTKDSFILHRRLSRDHRTIMVARSSPDFRLLLFVITM
jgi:hypothetical protein